MPSQEENNYQKPRPDLDDAQYDHAKLTQTRLKKKSFSFCKKRLCENRF